MEYLVFTVWFTVFHVLAYMTAGMLALKLSREEYEEKDRLLDFLRDMSVPGESAHVQRWLFPSQILRGVLLSVVLYPLLGPLGGVPVFLRFLFFAGLMFLYADFASAVPFPSNIEGAVYLKPRYLRTTSFWKFYFEGITYSVLFGLLAAIFLF